MSYLLKFNRLKIYVAVAFLFVVVIFTASVSRGGTVKTLSISSRNYFAAECTVSIDVRPKGREINREIFYELLRRITVFLNERHRDIVLIDFDYNEFEEIIIQTSGNCKVWRQKIIDLLPEFMKREFLEEQIKDYFNIKLLEKARNKVNQRNVVRIGALWRDLPPQESTVWNEFFMLNSSRYTVEECLAKVEFDYNNKTSAPDIAFLWHSLFRKVYEIDMSWSIFESAGTSYRIVILFFNHCDHMNDIIEYIFAISRKMTITPGKTVWDSWKEQGLTAYRIKTRDVRKEEFENF